MVINYTQITIIHLDLDQFSIQSYSTVLKIVISIPGGGISTMPEPLLLTDISSTPISRKVSVYIGGIHG